MAFKAFRILFRPSVRYEEKYVKHCKAGQENIDRESPESFLRQNQEVYQVPTNSDDADEDEGVATEITNRVVVQVAPKAF